MISCAGAPTHSPPARRRVTPRTRRGGAAAAHSHELRLRPVDGDGRLPRGLRRQRLHLLQPRRDGGPEGLPDQPGWADVPGGGRHRRDRLRRIGGRLVVHRRRGWLLLQLHDDARVQDEGRLRRHDEPGARLPGRGEPLHRGHRDLPQPLLRRGLGERHHHHGGRLPPVREALLRRLHRLQPHQHIPPRPPAPRDGGRHRGGARRHLPRHGRLDPDVRRRTASTPTPGRRAPRSSSSTWRRSGAAGSTTPASTPSSGRSAPAWPTWASGSTSPTARASGAATFRTLSAMLKYAVPGT